MLEFSRLSSARPSDGIRFTESRAFDVKTQFRRLFKDHPDYMAARKDHYVKKNGYKKRDDYIPWPTYTSTLDNDLVTSVNYFSLWPSVVFPVPSS
jgi:hypothetical protein